jgi:hypothetical protein
MHLSFQITLLDAIVWIKNAWGNISPVTISKCFRKCGIGALNKVDGTSIEELNNASDPSHLDPLLLGLTLEEYAAIGRFFHYIKCVIDR